MLKKFGTSTTKKRVKFDNLVLNLALQKIDSDSLKFDGKAVYSADKSTLVYVFNTDDSFKIPEGVEVIGRMAFRHKSLLKNVTIPSTVKVIEKDAFYGCENIDNIYIPATVKSVKENAFGGCDNLQKVTFAGELKHLCRYAFDDCDNLRTIIVPVGSDKASCAGVKIDILVRGNCSLKTNVHRLSENIRCVGIIDRYLEHSRILVFCNGGHNRYYIGSADWMPRNLINRIEVMTPVYDEELRADLLRTIEFGLRDTTNGHIVDGCGSNKIQKGQQFRSQEALYLAYQKKNGQEI